MIGDVVLNYYEASLNPNSPVNPKPRSPKKGGDSVFEVPWVQASCASLPESLVL